jgi:hypothetical protein
MRASPATSSRRRIPKPDAIRAFRPGAKPDPRHLLLTLWGSIWNPPYDLGAIDRLLTKDSSLSSAGTQITGRTASKDWVRPFQAKEREPRLENLDCFASADGMRALSRWIARGHNRGVLGTAPDDQLIEFTGIAIWEVREGKPAHNRVERSAWELQQKLTGADAKH